MWPPGGHFESDITENRQALAMATNYMHKKFEIEIPKTDGQGESSIPLHGGMITSETSHDMWFMSSSFVYNAKHR